MARMNRKERRAQGKSRVGFTAEAIVETPNGMAYRSDRSPETGDKAVVAFVLPGVSDGSAATELRLLAIALEEQELGLS